VLVVLRGYWNLPIVSQHCVTAVRFIQPDPYAARGLEDGLEKHGERKENKCEERWGRPRIDVSWVRTNAFSERRIVGWGHCAIWSFLFDER
jgi:hypothetical protein